MRCRRIRDIRPEEMESSLLTLHCISFICCHTGELSFLRGGGGGEGIFSFGKELQGFFPNNERGNFASATSIAAGVWFSYSDHVEYSRGYRYQGTINTFFQNMLV